MIVNKRLTNTKTWTSYWNNKNISTQIRSRNIVFFDTFSRILNNSEINSFVEIGGYPGTYSIFIKKYFELKTVDIIDFIDKDEIFNTILTNNELNEGDVNFIHADLFKFESPRKYGLVFSNGFIEHFIDTNEVLKKHVDLLSEKGTLFVTLPNFQGLNGWIQKKFHPEMHAIHNISCMDIKFLRNTAKELNLSNIEVFYKGGFSIWLENIKDKSFIFRMGFRLLWLIGKVFSKILPFQSKIFSPYICLIAKK